MSVREYIDINELIDEHFAYIFFLSTSPPPIFGCDESPLDFNQIFWGVLGTKCVCRPRMKPAPLEILN